MGLVEALANPALILQSGQMPLIIDPVPPRVTDVTAAGDLPGADPRDERVRGNLGPENAALFGNLRSLARVYKRDPRPAYTIQRGAPVEQHPGEAGFLWVHHPGAGGVRLFLGGEWNGGGDREIIKE
ncbi:MAG TPA: hypothetical protein VMT46_04400 [Anaerolineaceae bacterium]|nr:hypothetical protein [Anaerolineaceae bacterium]